MLYLGTMGWSYPFWVEKFYPKDTKQKDFLNYYSKKFNTVEIDSTFYRVPSKKTVDEWRNSVSNNFKFSVKIYGDITHVKNLNFDEGKLALFLERIQMLESTLGPILLQFPPWLKYENVSILKNLLDNFPKKIMLVLEFRNQSWYNKSIFYLLHDYNVSLVSVNLQKNNHEKLGKICYIRWEGNRKEVNGEKGEVEIDNRNELTSWSVKLHSFLNENLDVYGYFSKYYSGFPPFDVQEMKNQLNLLKNSDIKINVV